jgi:hypothetical protein
MNTMKKNSYKAFLAAWILAAFTSITALASSHREAPLISNDPLADNTDLYAFVSPDNPNTVTIIANYIPFELPEGGPNYFSFGEGIRYEIHIRNQAAGIKPGNGDDITYRLTFMQTNEDPSTFFNIRLGKQNLKTTYKCEKSTDGGSTWTMVIDGGIVPPANIGPRSIEAGVGLGMPYEQIWTNAIATITSGADAGTKIFCGPADDPFFVDLAGIFDLGNFRKDSKIDALAGFNCHTIALQIPISLLQKDGKSGSAAANILDGDYVIGVWASASRPRITTLSADGSKPTFSDDYVQVSRLGMPLTNEAIIPVGMKDKWNATSPYATTELDYVPYFTNPELGLYIGNGVFGEAVGTLLDLRIDSNSLGAGFDFRNTKDGLYGLYATNAGAGTALDTNGYGKVLLQQGAPRSVDLLPIFYTGAPNAIPYQLATGKTAGPLSEGKPFIHNFLPTLGDMLRLNMATPPTARTSADFSSEGLIQAAVLGLVDPRFNANKDLQAIPNMDGFPNGRRLEDDVTRIEMQAVGGLVLNAIGLWTDDYVSGQSPLTPQLLAKVTWNAGIDKNDVPLRTSFPYVALPHRGSDGLKRTAKVKDQPNSIGIRVPDSHFIGSNYPNPVATTTSMAFHLTESSEVNVTVYDTQGRMVETIMNDYRSAGDHDLSWTPSRGTAVGLYIAKLTVNGIPSGTMKITLTK